MPTRLRRALPLVAALATLPFTPAAHAANTFAATRIERSAGSTTRIEHWQIQSSAKVQRSGADVSDNGFFTHDWFAVSSRATVMAGLLENGKYPDVFYSDNLRAVEIPDASGNQFVIPWWYRTQFTLAKGAHDAHTLLRTNGLIALDNMLWNGAVADPANQDPKTVAIRELNLKIRDDPRVDCCLATVGDGVMLVRPRLL